LSDFVGAARDYLRYVLSDESGADPGDVQMMRLTRLLDKLAAATEFTSDEPADTTDEDDSTEAQSFYRRIGANFPGLGWYSTVLDINPEPSEDKIAVADAIDDLADIAMDLTAVVRVSESSGLDAARQEFNFRFRTHWGFHLRELQLYLYCRMTRF